MRLATLLLIFVLGFSATAQTPGDCEIGLDPLRAEAELDIGDVFARVFNTGNLFFGNFSEAAYIVPIGSGLSPMYDVGLWVGGLVEGELRVAGATYNDFEFWPGPLDENANPPDDCLAYNRIYRVSRYDVQRYLDLGETTDDLRDWPVELGAPVLDGDGNPENYNLEGGDQPAIYGDQTLWWVMNDVGNVHRNTLTPPIGLEVQVTAWAVAEGPTSLLQSTYYSYKLINRTNSVLDSTYVALFADPDLGDASDDFVGVDTTASLSFVYNADNVDGEPPWSYGLAPPAAGFKIVQGPIGLANNRDDDFDGEVDEYGEELGITAFNYFVSGFSGPLADPNNGEEIYNIMHGTWTDGSPMEEGDNGYQSGGAITTFAYPGDPVTNSFWSEVNTDGIGTPTDAGGDRRSVTSVGPFRLQPGESTDFVFAIVFGRGSDHLDSISQLRQAAHQVEIAYEDGYFDPVRVEGHVQLPPADGSQPIQLSLASPNPFTDQTTIRYSLPAALDIKIAAFDVLGREVAVLAEGEQPRGEHEAVLDGAYLAPGVYFVRFEGGNASQTIRVVKR